MDIKLSVNIRKCRKGRSLTQEQLAEVLGVTVGAVYKWEAGLSNPELSMLMEIADFFDTSVDALLGYEMKDNGLKTTLDRMYSFINDRDISGIPEAEKALKRYPNNFEVVYRCATLFHFLGNDHKDKALLMRSLELYDKARTLISQNTRLRLNETIISGNMAFVYNALGKTQKAAEILTENNTGGIYDSIIGWLLVNCKDYNKAEEYLTNGFINGISMLLNFMYGYALLQIRRKDYNKAEEVILWGKALMQDLRASDDMSYYDRLTSVALFLLGYVHLKQGRKDEAKDMLRSAIDMAARFDSSPCYAVGSIRFMSSDNKASQYDIMGKTAADSLEFSRKELNSKELDILWKEITENG